MIGDIPVIDGVVHGFDFNQANMLNMPPGRIHAQAHLAKTPRQPKYARYILEQDRYERKHTAEEMVSCCFAESQTDIAVYHTVRRIGYMNVGEWSPWDVGLEMRERAGNERVLIMAGLTDPFDTKRSIDELDEMIEQHDVIGLKLYPYDWDARRQELRQFLLNDEDVAFPLIDHVRSRGLRSISVHKAIGSIIQCFGVTDVEAAVTTFPDMQFEIVHAGWAFMEDTAILAQRRNVWLNLEGTASLLGMAPRRFAEILGKFLHKGGGEPGAEDRIIWATGVMAVHPQPLLDLFLDFQMPEDLMEGYGYPEVTMDMKRKILAGNYARKIGRDLDSMIAAIPDDEYKDRQRSGNLAEPWSKVPMEAEPTRVAS
jgi:hypothetical protein